jgi:SsrA-binding protein
MKPSNPSATNRKAFRDYALFDKWECGIELKGGEVKSIRAGEVSFVDSFARVEGQEVILYNLHITPYIHATIDSVEADRPRKLLLHKREIKKLLGLVTQKGFVLVPTRVYFNKRGFVKLEIALGKGKKIYDKRETIKKRDIERSLKKITKHRQR